MPIATPERNRANVLTSKLDANTLEAVATKEVAFENDTFDPASEMMFAFDAVSNKSTVRLLKDTLDPCKVKADKFDTLTFELLMTAMDALEVEKDGRAKFENEKFIHEILLKVPFELNILSTFMVAMFAKVFDREAM